MSLIKPLLEFRPNKMDIIFATKTFIAGILALYIAFSLDLDYPMWALGTVFVIANPYSGMTSSKSMYRLLGTLLGATFAVSITPYLINTPLLFTLVLAVWIGFCLYISLLDRTPRSYFFMLAGYTAVIICFNTIAHIETTSIFDMALGRFLEIGLGVVCSAVVSATIFPMHLGPVLENRVMKTMQDTSKLYDRILLDDQQQKNYTDLLANITRDTSEIHAMAVHLNYEKSKFKVMTKSLQELLHQVTMLVANLVAISERLKQLDQIDLEYRQYLTRLHGNLAHFLSDYDLLEDHDFHHLPQCFYDDFDLIFEHAKPEQHVGLSSLKMDLRHFIQNVRSVKLIWKHIQQGDNTLPESITPLTTQYPSLHRDHGVAVRGGVSAFLIICIASSLWILSGWKAGFMMAQLAAICGCILTALDNPVPALKVFIRGSIYSAFCVFIYAYGIFPQVTAFWQLVVVLAPFLIYFLSMFPHPPLLGFGLPMVMATVMGLNLHNQYSLDQITFFDGSIGSVLGPIIAACVIDFVRAMSPDMSAQRILSSHYRNMRRAIFMHYDLGFKTHLRAILDRVGVLNTKQIQSETLKENVNNALIEASAAIDLTRLQEFLIKIPSDSEVVKNIQILQQQLYKWFKSKEKDQTDQLHVQQEMLRDIMLQLDQLESSAFSLEDNETRLRILISVNNIRSSICHADHIHTFDTANLVGV